MSPGTFFRNFFLDSTLKESERPKRPEGYEKDVSVFSFVFSKIANIVRNLSLR